MTTPKSFFMYVTDLETKIQSTYENGISMVQAEALAGEFLKAQLSVSRELTKSDLDSRMRKTGVKAIKAAVYMEAASKGDKRPTQDMLAAIVDANEIAAGEQRKLDEAEVSKAELQRYYDIFKEAHIFMRSISRGTNG